MNDLAPLAIHHIGVSRIHLLGCFRWVNASHSRAQSRHRESANHNTALLIISMHSHQRPAHGEVGMNGARYVPRHAHGWSNDQKREASSGELHDNCHAHRKLSQELLGNGCLCEPLCLAVMEIIDGLVNASTHVPKTVGRTDQGITTKVEQASANHLHRWNISKSLGQTLDQTRLRICKADA